MLYNIFGEFGDAIDGGYITFSVFLIIYIPFLIFFIIKRKTLLYHLITLLFFIYAHMLFILVFCPIPIDNTALDSIRVMQQGSYFNIIPFKDIIFFVMWPLKNHFELQSSLKNIFGNIVAFMPFGFLFPVINKKFLCLKKMVWMSFFVPLGIESVQLIGSLCMKAVWKFADVDDIILNMSGMLAGYFILRLFIKLSNKVLHVDLIRTVNRQ